MGSHVAMLRGAALLSSLALASGCFQPRVGPDELRDGDGLPVDRFVDAATSACGGPDPSPLTSLHVVVRTSAFGGRFAPRNVGAIWIEDAAGRFVEAIEVWANTRARYLTRFQAASGGDKIDAITSATLATHRVHDLRWDLTDHAGCEVANGDYAIVMETTDRDGTGASHAIPFAKTGAPATLTPADAPNFHDLVLTLE